MARTRRQNVDPLRGAVAALGVAARTGGDVDAARRRLHTEKVRRAINDALAAPEAPTPAQRAELAALLLGDQR